MLHQIYVDICIHISGDRIGVLIVKVAVVKVYLCSSTCDLRLSQVTPNQATVDKVIQEYC